MRLRQYRGPFAKGDSVSTIGTYDGEWVHIGIQVPKRQPIANSNRHVNDDDDDKAFVRSGAATPDIEINDQRFYVNEFGIIEFTGIAGASYTITFLKDMPVGTIIDLLFKDLDEE